jgi:hypothetical protein
MLIVDDAINVVSDIPSHSESLLFLNNIESAKQRVLSTLGYLKFVKFARILSMRSYSYFAAFL